MNNVDHFSSLNRTLNITSPQENTTHTTSHHGDDKQEESGWTSYFEDFSNYVSRNEYERSSSSAEFGSPSMVSDATSFPPRKSSQPNSSNDHHQHLGAGHYSLEASPPNMPIRRLKFRKTRTTEIFSHDDSLEDTASSPVNSPKVSDFGAVVMNPAGRAANDHFSISSLGKGSSIDHGYGRKDADKRHEIGCSGNITNDRMELNKRGLCLVHVSMLVSYLG